MKTMLHVLLGTKTQYFPTVLVGLLLVGGGLWMKTEVDELNSIADEIMQPLAMPMHSRFWDESQFQNTQKPGAPVVDPGVRTPPGTKVQVGT